MAYLEMKPEYQEGPQTKEGFERTVVALFKATKAKGKSSKSPHHANLRRPTEVSLTLKI
jgi:hypothetical protein